MINMNNYNIEYLFKGKIIRVNYNSTIPDIYKYVDEVVKGEIILIKKVIQFNLTIR